MPWESGQYQRGTQTVDKWANKTIQVQRLSGTSKWLNAHAQSPRAMFKLLRSDIERAHGLSIRPRYTVSYNAGDMLPVWQDVWLVDTPGTGPLPAVHALPEWDGTPEVERKWHDALEPIVTRLRANNTSYPRLEGYMPVPGDNGEARVDRVRMVYLDAAITTSNGKLDDLVLVVLHYADGSQEDGAGSGPPH
jgi:hypothetical protein